MMNMKSGRLQVLWILWLPVAFPGLAGVACRSWCALRWPSPAPLPVGNPLPPVGRLALLRLARPLGTFGRQGVWQRTRFPRPSHQLQGLVARNWLGFAATHLISKARLARRPSRCRAPRSCDMLCFPSSILKSRVSPMRQFVDRGLTH